MIDIESYMGGFKQSISKRLERYEEKLYGIEISQSECKRRLRNLEVARKRSDKNGEIELQHVNDSFFYFIFNFFI